MKKFHKKYYIYFCVIFNIRMELSEGSTYTFTIEKYISLPDGSYFILFAEFNRKYLLPAAFYREFKLRIGQKIKCRIDKINCNGKIFLEPEHPLYKAGDSDLFVLTGKEERLKYKTKEKYWVINAVSKLTNRAVVQDFSICGKINFPYECKCKVVKIKKGELVLEIIEGVE